MSADANAREAGLDGHDSAAPGDTPEDTPFGPGEDATETERAVWAALDEVEDPHLPLSLVEMAMIYDVRVEESGAETDGDAETGGAAATVEISFPCMGCPAYDFIHEDIRGACHDVGVDAVEIDVVWDPIWSKDMMPARAKETLRESGIGI